MSKQIEALKLALEALEYWHVRDEFSTQTSKAITAIREALSEQPAQQEKRMPITDDNGQALRPQYRVIEKCGKWTLLYDQHQIGNVVRHEFRIQKLQHDIVLYPGITLAEAQKRFREKVEADHE